MTVEFAQFLMAASAVVLVVMFMILMVRKPAQREKRSTVSFYNQRTDYDRWG